MQRIQSFLQTVVQSWNSGRSGKIVVGAGVALVLCLVCTLCSAVQNVISPRSTASPTAAVAQATDTPRPTNTPVPTNTPIPPTAAPKPTNTPQPKPTAAPTSPPAATATPFVAGIPGLHPVDIKVELGNRGFDCGDVEEGVTHYSWTCRREVSTIEFVVTFYARSLDTVDFVTAVVLQPASPAVEIASPVLGFMATMPYDNAEPDAARAWVEQTLPTLEGEGDVRTAEFGGVPFELFGSPAALNLQYGALE